jgi:hypothetical protein
MVARIVAAILAGGLSGCMLFDIQEQQEKLDGLCTLSGDVEPARFSSASAQVPVIAFCKRWRGRMAGNRLLRDG